MSAPLSRRGVLAGVTALAAGAVVPTLAAGEEAGMAELLRQRDVAVRALRIYRDLSPPQRVAWLRMGQRIADGMSPREAGYRMHRELGATAREARDRVDAVLARRSVERGEVA